MTAGMDDRERKVADLVVALAMLVVLGVSVLWRPETLPPMSLCRFHAWTGIPCPGCGLTRSFCAISHGALHDAWRLNPFGFLFFAVALLLLAHPLLRRLTPAVERHLFSGRCLAIAVPVVVVAMVVFGVVRAVWMPPLPSG